ncbi:MAG: PaaI family thioesterase [Desulfovibrio sp.]|jgi:acyl-CoA thioesterase|nr:PaaI family thioesterase [Desulfovibrio sp.]
MEKNLERIREYFAADNFAAHAGMVIDFAGEEGVQCGMEIAELHRNADRAVQGGVIFTLADFAFGVHSNLGRVLGREKGNTVGQSCGISYFRQPAGKRLIARSTLLSKGRRMRVYRVEVCDELGNAVAEMIGNGFTIGA